MFYHKQQIKTDIFRNNFFSLKAVYCSRRGLQNNFFILILKYFMLFPYSAEKSEAESETKTRLKSRAETK